jgi:hypothetical protein
MASEFVAVIQLVANLIPLSYSKMTKNDYEEVAHTQRTFWPIFEYIPDKPAAMKSAIPNSPSGDPGNSCGVRWTNPGRPAWGNDRFATEAESARIMSH